MPTSSTYLRRESWQNLVRPYFYLGQHVSLRGLLLARYTSVRPCCQALESCKTGEVYQLHGFGPFRVWLQPLVRPSDANIHLGVHMEIENVYQTKESNISNLLDWELVSAFLLAFTHYNRGREQILISYWENIRALVANTIRIVYGGSHIGTQDETFVFSQIAMCS